VGLVLFADQVQNYFSPRKGQANVLRLIREMISVEPQVRETSLDNALQFLNRVQKRRSVVFLVSDFQTAASRQALAVSNGRHDLIGITMSDPRERALPDVGIISFRDAETGELVEVDARHPRVRELFRQQSAQRAEENSQALRRAGVDELAISTTEPYVNSLRRFFEARERRFR
jgi:uncharacterized protein (DUF58 family)